MPIMVVSHPLIGYVFIPTFFISMALFKTKIGEIRYENSSPSFLLVSMINLGLLLGITYTAWYVLSTEIWSGFLGGLIQYSQGIERATTASADVSGRASALSTAELVELFLVRYGGEAVVGLLTTLGVGLYHTGKSKLEPGRGGHFIMILLTVWMCASGIWLFVGLVEPQVTVPPLRFLRLIYLPVRDLRRTRRSMGRRLRYRSHDVDSDRSVHLLGGRRTVSRFDADGFVLRRTPHDRRKRSTVPSRNRRNGLVARE